MTNANRYCYRQGAESLAPAGAVRAERTLSSSAGFPLAAGKQSPMSVVFGPEASMVSPIVTMSFNAMGRPARTGGGHVTLMNRYGDRVDVIVTPVDGLIRMEQVR